CVDRQDLLDVVDDDAGGAAFGLDDDDVRAVAALAREAEARRQVADGDDLAAQADHALDPVDVRRDGARLRVADDLLDLRDRQRVLLLAEREDDELLRAFRDGVGRRHASSIESRCAAVIDRGWPEVRRGQPFRRLDLLDRRKYVRRRAPTMRAWS